MAKRKIAVIGIGKISQDQHLPVIDGHRREIVLRQPKADQRVALGQYQHGMRVRVRGHGGHDAKVRGLVVWA